MSKNIFISNRLPVTITIGESGVAFTPSIGGLATGLKSVHEDKKSLWLGWSGLSSDSLSDPEMKTIDRELLSAHNSAPVFLSEEDINDYYYGFCNRTIWPLFHYFMGQIEYEHRHWEAYRRVNRKFFERLEEVIEDGDTIWVHDYQLMLLPEMIREKYPDTTIGFFLHIPFPSYELFRLLPWREEILKGLLGSDLIGFHTYDYTRHFLSSVRRILGYEHNLGYLQMGQRSIKADAFPMGIDYKRYHDALDTDAIREESDDVLKKAQGTKLILSVDRLDYTKGIPERIKSYAEFLRIYPQYREKVTMILIVAPSRTEVDTYSDLLKEIQELVSNTNGEHGTIGWVPVWFFYRSFGFENLTAIYAAADVLLVTPLRDGMNLVVKEYIAARRDAKGMVVLSETAGAASELGEAVIVNANNIREVAEGIRNALEMPEKEKMNRNKIMHQRLKHYDVEFWANDFLQNLAEVKDRQKEHMLIKMDKKNTEHLIKAKKDAGKRLFLLDYDGTLVQFKDKPEYAVPDKELLELITRLAEDKKNTVVIISGRDRNTLEEWFGKLKINLVAAHGMWVREEGREWERIEILSNEWKENIRPILEMHTARTPGSLVEEKEYSLAWHYRRCEPELAAVRVNELKDALDDLIGNLNIGLLSGNKVIEIKDTGVNKGRAASIWLNREEWDFIFAAGDDWTDEDIFNILPDDAWSIKVGSGVSRARFRVDRTENVRELLKRLAEK
jgi:trehalose 6-phosphate synthase/phosphatase